MSDVALGLVAVGSCGLVGASVPSPVVALGYRALQYSGLAWLAYSLDGRRELLELVACAVVIWLTADAAVASAERSVP